MHFPARDRYWATGPHATANTGSRDDGGQAAQAISHRRGTIRLRHLILFFGNDSVEGLALLDVAKIVARQLLDGLKARGKIVDFPVNQTVAIMSTRLSCCCRSMAVESSR
jgi:hypothetical protein